MKAKKILLASATLLLTSFIANAQWSTNPAINNAICVRNSVQVDPVIVSDGSGGAIIAWYEFVNGSNDIYAQRIDSAGIVQWTADGVEICGAVGDQVIPALVSDGLGGAIITWHDYRFVTTDIYAQRINSAGVVQWATNGVVICAAVQNQFTPSIISDGSGGAIITWQDSRNGVSNQDIYAQRINAAGVVQWTTDGVAISVASYNQEYPTLVSDGSGGAIVTWQDYRNIFGTSYDIFAQRINSAGVVQWTTDGVAISNAANIQQYPTLVSDGSGGAIITWTDYRAGINFPHIYAQRINAAGLVLWTVDGVAISTPLSDQIFPNLVSDGSGGAIITWQDAQNGGYDIYAQSINAAGVVQWTTGGVAICNAMQLQRYPAIVSDVSGGAIITWEDERSLSNYFDIYAQRINAAGVVQWTIDGVAIGIATDNQDNPALVADGSGGAIITWQDRRSLLDYDLYVQKIFAGGSIGCSTPTTPGSISGAGTICSASSNTYSIAAVSGATSYTWVLPSGWSGTSTTNSITTTASATSGNISVTATNACGTSTAQLLAVTVNSTPATPGSISGAGTICSASSNTYSIAAVSGATSYTWVLPNGWSGTSTTNSITTTASATSGNISVTATNACGTSTAQLLAISVSPLPVLTTSLSVLTITSDQNAATYQWIDCNTNSSILGQTNQSYTATVNGSYAVVVTLGSCSDTSACVTILNVGISELSNFGVQLSIYPNPFSTSTTLQTNYFLKNATLSVYNVYGDEVEQINKLSGQTIAFNRISLPVGLYFIQLVENGKILSVNKLIITD